MIKAFVSKTLSSRITARTLKTEKDVENLKNVVVWEVFKIDENGNIISLWKSDFARMMEQINL